MEKKPEGKIKTILPVKEMKYTQSVEEMKILVNNLKDQMSACPKDDLIFHLSERVDYYSIIRNFTLRIKSPESNNEAMKKFKDNLLSDIASLDSFIVIPNINSFDIEAQSNKGSKFKVPRVYDIKGDEAILGEASPNQYYLFFYDNITDLGTFISRNKNINIIISCVGINMSFYSTKNWLKNNGLLNNKKFLFYFTDINNKSSHSSTNLKLNNLPRIAFINNGNIAEDKSIKNINLFDVQRDLISRVAENGQASGDQAKAEKFVYLDNKKKKKVVKGLNIFLKNNGLTDVSFYVKSKISIDKKGIKKIKCHPIFFGQADLSVKNKIDNLINILNGQQLFYDIQCKIKFNK